MRLGKVHSMNRFDRSIGLAARIVSAMFLLGCAAFAFGQCGTSTITATITDPDSIVWAGGHATITLYNPDLTQKPLCNKTNVPLTAGQLSQTVTLNSAGTLSVTVVDSAQINTGTTRWVFSLQSLTSAPPSVIPPLAVNANADLSSSFSSQVTAPRFNAIANSFGYADLETLPNPCVTADQYVNTGTVTPGPRYCKNGTWFSGGGASLAVQTEGTPNTSQTLLNFHAGNGIQVSNPSGGIEQISSTNANGGAPFPSNANIVLFGTSQLGVTDTCVNAAFTISASTVTGGVGTFISGNGYTAGNIVTLYRFTGTGAVLNQQKVTILSTGLSSTQFEANVSGITSGTTGAGFVGCSYMAATDIQTSPALPSNTTAYLFSPANTTVAGLIADYPTDVHPLSPAVTGKFGVLFIEGGTFEIFSNPGQMTLVESGLQTLWQTAHTDGWIVIAMNLFDGAFGGGNSNSGPDLKVVNDWMNGQGSQAFPVGVSPNTNPCIGCYYDGLIDIHGQFPDRSNTFLYNSTHLTSSGNNLLGGMINNDLLTLTSLPMQYSYCTGENDYGCASTPNHWAGLQDAYQGVNTNLAAMCADDLPIGNSPDSQICLFSENAGGNHPFLAVMDNNLQRSIGFHNNGSGLLDTYLQGDMPFGWNGQTGGSSPQTAPDTCMTRIAAGGEVDFGNCSTVGDVSSGTAQKYIALNTTHVSGHSFDCLGTGCPGTAPTIVTATVGLSNGYSQSENCTVNGTPETCVEQDFDTGALNNATTTTVSLLTSITHGLMSCVCTDNSGRVQTGNVQPIGCNVAGQSLPFTTVQMWVGATGETASCKVKGY